MLQVQRVMLNCRYKNRSLFSRERGINYRLALDVETSARQNYDYSTRISIDLAYGWQPGSVDLVLAGGEPVVTPAVPGPIFTASEQATLDSIPEAVRRGQEQKKAGNDE
jgi:hypothetical protein